MLYLASLFDCPCSTPIICITNYSTFKRFWDAHIFGLSTKSLETLGVTSVRTSVRTSVTRFLGNRSLLFSETLQLVRAFRCEKNVPSAFLKIFTVLAILAKNWSKWAIWLDVCNSLFKGCNCLLYTSPSPRD